MSMVEEKVKAIIVEKLGVDEADINHEASFTNDLGADSLDIVELVMEFEKEFNIDIPDEDAEKLRTVGDAVAYLNGKVGASRPSGESAPSPVTTTRRGVLAIGRDG